MSIGAVATPILSSLLNSLNPQAQGTQRRGGSNAGSSFQQIQQELEQLGSDLQSGNLSQAQQDYSTLASSFPFLSTSPNSPGSSASSPQNLSGSSASPAAGAGGNVIQQDMAALDNDLQAGNLPQAQQDFTTLEQALQRARGGEWSHRFGGHAGANAGSGTVQNDVGALAQALQSGNLSSAQTAFAALQMNLQSFASNGFAAWSAVGGSHTPGMKLPGASPAAYALTSGAGLNVVG